MVDAKITSNNNDSHYKETLENGLRILAWKIARAYLLDKKKKRKPNYAR